MKRVQIFLLVMMFGLAADANADALADCGIALKSTLSKPFIELRITVDQSGISADHYQLIFMRRDPLTDLPTDDMSIKISDLVGNYNSRD